MIPWQPLRRTAALVTLAAACTSAAAAPVTLNYSGSVSGYFNGDLSGFAPTGTVVSLSLTFNDTFSDGSYSFLDDSGPVNGVLSLGGLTYTFDDYAAWGYYTDNANALLSVGLQVLGAGPAPAGAELFGLFVNFSLSLAVTEVMRLGFVVGPGVNFSYVEISGSGQATPVSAVPLPSTLALLGAAFLAWPLVRRRA